MSDMTKASKVVVLDLINSDNNKGITYGVVDIGLPTVNSTGLLNTSVTLTAKVGSGFTGSQTFKYNRLHLNTAILVPSGKDATFSLGDSTRIADIIPELNALLNINLGVEDFVDGDLPTFTGGIPNETHDVQVVAKADSLAYIGSLTFQLRSDEIDLAEYLTVTDLNGLTYVPV